MDTSVTFVFRNRTYSANIYFDLSNSPYCMFVDLTDKELIEEFGDDISIESDGNDLLPSIDDYPKLVTLKNAIFEAVKHDPAFRTERSIQDKKPPFRNSEKV